MTFQGWNRLSFPSVIAQFILEVINYIWDKQILTSEIFAY
jgi:hypothetical protein